MTLDGDDPRSLLFRQDLFGAPVRLGAVVEIRADVDDDTIEASFLGRRGVVTGLFYDDPVAQLPAAPLVVVAVEALGEELFFASELRAVRQVSGLRGAQRQMQ
jgi:hypothetical protein